MHGTRAPQPQEKQAPQVWTRVAGLIRVQGVELTVGEMSKNPKPTCSTLQIAKGTGNMKRVPTDSCPFNLCKRLSAGSLGVGQQDRKKETTTQRHSMKLARSSQEFRAISEK